MRRLTLTIAFLVAMGVSIPQPALAQPAPCIRGVSMCAVAAQSGSVTIAPAQTAGVISETPGDGTPPSGSAYLPIGNYISPSSGSSIFSRSYLLFPLDSIPVGVTVTSAQLEVDMDLFPFAGSGMFGAYNVTAGWDESMTWATRAPADPTPRSSTLVASTPGTYAWDVTDLVNGWLSGSPNNGLMLAAIPPVDSGSLGSSGFAARGLGRTSASPPRLIVSWGALTLKGGTIRGMVFLDVDQDGVFDAGESGLAGIPIHVETNGSWATDLVTGDDGTYGPAGLKPAQYRVRIDVPPGYVATTPLGRGPFALNGNAVTGQDFGLASVPVLLPESGALGATAGSVALLLLAAGAALMLTGTLLRASASIRG